jgi:hypothetical protein
VVVVWGVIEIRVFAVTEKGKVTVTESRGN